MAWELFRRDSSGGFEMVGVDGDLLTEAPIAGLPIAVEVMVTAPSTHPDVMVETEAGIESATAHLDGRLAGTVRGTDTLRTLVYLPNDDDARRLSEIPLPSRASISVAPAVDPDWLSFDLFRPVGMEDQSMADLRVMAALHDAGDRGGVRRIEHVVVGLASDRRDPFAAAVSSLGFSIGPEVVAHEIGVSHDADPADITDDAWTIRQIAERFGATYDGWGCPVVGNHTRTPKRRWWRR